MLQNKNTSYNTFSFYIQITHQSYYLKKLYYVFSLSYTQKRKIVHVIQELIRD
jgi:hypothetical protein